VPPPIAPPPLVRPPPPKPQPPRAPVVAPPRPQAPAVAPAAPAPPRPAPPSPAPAAPAPPPSAAIEGSYVTSLRGYYQRITKYPTSKEARLLKPAGAVVVRFTLTRSGEVKDVVVDRSSGNQILDRAALATVKSGSPPQFPEQAWTSASEHVFTVTLEFDPNS